MAQTKNPLKAVQALPRRFEARTKASRAENLIIMLRDAFTAKKPAALRTAGHRFPQHMVVTALLCEVYHDLDRILKR